MLARVTLLVLADLRKRMIEFLGFKDRGGGPVAAGPVLVQHGLLFYGAGEKYIVRFGVLIWKAQVVGPSEAKFFQNLIDQFLPSECLVVFGERKLALVVKVTTEFQNRTGSPIGRPPIVFAETRFEVMIRKQLLSLPKLSDFWHSQKFRMIVKFVFLRHVGATPRTGWSDSWPVRW